VTQLIAQLTGVGAVGAFVFAFSLLAWYAIKVTLGVRVAPEEELEGLDLGEHGMEAYPGFAKEGGTDAHSPGSLAPEAVAVYTKSVLRSQEGS
jgi:Amt family ammonium transporter